MGEPITFRIGAADAFENACSLDATMVQVTVCRLDRSCEQPGSQGGNLTVPHSVEILEDRSTERPGVFSPQVTPPSSSLLVSVNVAPGHNGVASLIVARYGALQTALPVELVDAHALLDKEFEPTPREQSLS